MAAVTIFISYSHDGEEHAERVRGLAASLTRDGCDCRLDVHKDSGEDWPMWMTRQLEEADFILCVVTQTYERRFRDRELPDIGKGVGWEAGLICRLLYRKKLHNDRIFPVLFESADREHIPIELDGYDFFLLDKVSGYVPLLRKVLNRPRHPKPETGTPPDLASQQTTPLFPRPGDTASDHEHTAPSIQPPAPSIAPSRLLELGVTSRFEELVGREKERQMLTEAWNDRRTHVLIFVAEGGVGKTSLVADWMMDFVKADWEGVDAFFDWSFYSQGTRDQTAANSGQFLDAALRHFHQTDLAGSRSTADAKARRLAECVARGRTLLLLDGVEPLQHPRKPGVMDGRFKDTGFEGLLKQLAQLPGAGGLCVVTTRVPVVDLTRFHGGTVREEPLDHLSDTAAARLLHQAGACCSGNVKIGPDDRELLAAAKELKGHALTVQLLGGYLKHAHGGDIRRRDRVDWTRAIGEEQEGHARVVMETYERWFEPQGDSGRRQLAALRLLGFFDRPASAACLDALRAGDPIPGLTEPLAGLNAEDWKRVLTRLEEEHRLVSLDRSGPRIDQVDCHALIREYFTHQLREERNAAWTEGHRRLYEHLCETADHRPGTLVGLQPLYQAVSHGCQAGLHRKAYVDIYRNRILRGTGSGGFYSTEKLGAQLGAVACFFDHPWSVVSPNLSETGQAWLLSVAAFKLRALGRLTEAVEPMRSGLKMVIESEDWRGAAQGSANLGELELSVGDVSAAVEDAGQSVTFADRSGDEFQRMGTRTTHACALHQAGDRDAAWHLFEKAEARQAERQPEYPRLYSVRGFKYCDLLLSGAERAAWRATLECGDLPPLWISSGKDGGRASVLPDLESGEYQSGDKSPHSKACDAITGRATQTLEWVKQASEASLLTIALDHLTLARAALYQAVLSSSKLQIPNFDSDHLTAAVNGLRQSGDAWMLPRGLLTRAWHRRLTDNASGGASDLDEAWEIAERGPMPLFQADVLLTRVRLFGGEGSGVGCPVSGKSDPESEARAQESGYPWDSPQEDLAEARGLIEKHGYHRRDEELEDAEKAILRKEDE